MDLSGTTCYFFTGIQYDLFQIFLYIAFNPTNTATKAKIDMFKVKLPLQ